MLGFMLIRKWILNETISWIFSIRKLKINQSEFLNHILLYLKVYYNFCGTAHGDKNENLSQNMSCISSYWQGILDVMINYR